jgi:hypothetical protein
MRALLDQNLTTSSSQPLPSVMQWETANEHIIDRLSVGESAFNEPDVVVRG